MLAKLLVILHEGEFLTCREIFLLDCVDILLETTL
jgi:hypothetical protein